MRAKLTKHARDRASQRVVAKFELYRAEGQSLSSWLRQEVMAIEAEKNLDEGRSIIRHHGATWVLLKDKASQTVTLLTIMKKCRRRRRHNPKGGRRGKKIDKIEKKKGQS